jgi:hypothetical protein
VSVAAERCSLLPRARASEPTASARGIEPRTSGPLGPISTPFFVLDADDVAGVCLSLLALID